MIKIAICDDSKADGEFVADLTRRWGQSSGSQISLSIFPSAEAFLFRYSENKDVDILLLDIEMPHMDGVTMAKQIRRENETVQIIFITGYSDYISEGYEVAALHYLLKPINPDKLFEVLTRAADKLNKNERTVLIEQSGETIRIPLYEISYIDVHQNYITVHAQRVHAKRDYTIKKTLADFEKLLDDRFFRVGRSAVVNLSYIVRVTKTDAYLSDGSVVPIPKTAYEPLNRAIISMN